MSFSRTKKRLRFFLTILLIMSFTNCIFPGTLFAESNGYTVSANQENSSSPDSDLTAEASNEEDDESVTTSVYNEDNEPVLSGDEEENESVTSVYEEEKESVVSVYGDPLHR